ncbi:MAG: hypothetical protein WBK67_02360 [Minisyncoccales bacterium]
MPNSFIKNVNDIAEDLAGGALSKIVKINDNIDTFEFRVLESFDELSAHTTAKENELNAHTLVKEDELNEHKSVKVAELNAHTLVKEGELDAHTLEKKAEVEAYKVVKVTDLNTYTGTKKTELNTHKDVKVAELNAHTLVKEAEVTAHTDEKKVELDSYTQNEKKSELDAHTQTIISHVDIVKSKTQRYLRDVEMMYEEFSELAVSVTKDKQEIESAKESVLDKTSEVMANAIAISLAKVSCDEQAEIALQAQVLAVTKASEAFDSAAQAHASEEVALAEAHDAQNSAALANEFKNAAGVSATAAQNSASGASLSASVASTQAQDAALSAIAADNSADLAMSGANVYPALADGLAATTEGGYFNVIGSGEIYLSIYRKVAGLAVLQNQIYGKLANDRVLGSIDFTIRTGLVNSLVAAGIQSY